MNVTYMIQDCNTFNGVQYQVSIDLSSAALYGVTNPSLVSRAHGLVVDSNPPCQRGATCVNNLSNYTCACANNENGTLCQECVIDHVGSQCQNYCPPTAIHMMESCNTTLVSSVIDTASTITGLSGALFAYIEGNNTCFGDTMIVLLAVTGSMTSTWVRFGFSASSGHLALQIPNATPATTTDTSGLVLASITDGWHQFAFTISAGTVSFYMDSLLLSTVNSGASPPALLNGPLTIGPLPMRLTMVYWFHTLLVASDIRNLYVNNAVPTTPAFQLSFAEQVGTYTANLGSLGGVVDFVGNFYNSTGCIEWTTCTQTCSPSKCQNGGTCLAQNPDTALNGYNCSCPVGYQGEACQYNTDLNWCASQPCANGGTCNLNYLLGSASAAQCSLLNSTTGFSCACAAGYSGVDCQTTINVCASNPCYSPGTCVNGINSFTCNCPPGYSGTLCQTQIDTCASSPCVNGGTCLDLINGWQCACLAGYSGLQCQTDIDECASTPCVNSGSCVDGTNSFTCKCIAGYSGALCQTTINVCASNPCSSPGTCVNGINSFTCNCPAGYSGTYCQTQIDTCASNPCLPGIPCIDQINGYICNFCASSPCLDAGMFCRRFPSFLFVLDLDLVMDWFLGTCINNANDTGWQCMCLPPFSGSICQYNNESNSCANNTCANGSTCHNIVEYPFGYVPLLGLI